MTAQFDRIIGFILQKEGGYVNDPRDAGGETNFGISKRSYPMLDIKSLTVEQAKAIYQSDFYGKIQGDKLPFPIALVMTDFAVHSGVGNAVRQAQSLLKVNPVDGILGNRTLAAITGIKDILQWVESYADARVTFYRKLAINRPSQLRFLYGWEDRAHHAQLAATKQPLHPELA